MRSRFEAQLSLLNEMLIEMGAMIGKAITLAVDALETQDVALANQAIAFDAEIDRQEKDIEALCLKLLLQQQPVARDLRLISSALKMITDMERIGDHAADISELTLLLAGSKYTKKLEHIPEMAVATSKMVTDSVKAFVEGDAVLARAVIASDDMVDDLFTTVKNSWIQHIRDGTADGEQAVDLMMVAKYFERIGDHAVNIAESVVFSITGKRVKKGANGVDR
ncbi:MAG: phosphate signaling complex protein PhoU [Oscillospiraceae bacterium]|nr:phosphate signaling complex protein PhoU [Oscillospiraceae bacterium]